MAPRSGARELTMKKALEAIESGNRSNGATGLENLIHIFKHQATASDLLKLDDKSYHRLFEAIFRYTLTEKEAYYHGKGAKSVALGRLSKCAEVLRLSVEHGASKVKRKTFLAVVDHIADILPHPDDGLVPPLVADYIKALATLLGHGANVEILATHNSDGWYTCVDFVVDTITHYAGNDDRDTGVPRASPAPSASSAPSAPLAPLAGPSPGLQLSTPRSLNSNKRNNGNERPLRGQLSDLMECLSYLVSASNAPVLQRSKEIASVALHVLQLRYLGLSQLHQLAFAVINALLVATQTDDTAQASSMAVECLPLIIYWWQAKAASKYDALLNAVRMEMLKVLYNIRLQLEFLARKHLEDTTLFEYIENLLEVLWSEYSKRDERAQLQQDDLAYAASHVATNYFRIHSFILRPFNIEGERQWAVVQIIAMLESITWRRSRTSALDGNNDNSEQPRKKQRKDVGFGRLRHKLRSPDPSTQFTTLQMIPFFVSDVEVTVEEAYDLLSILLGLVTNRDSRLSTWAIIASASLCIKSAAADHSLNGLWRQTWQVAVRSVSMTGTCRAASFLLYSIATNNLLSYSEIMGDISDMVTTADVNGPAVLVDSSLLLMTALLQLRNHHLPNASHATNNHIVRWMLSRWYPADATFITSYSMHVSPLNIANLIRATCGQKELSVSDVCQTISGPISETLLLLHERESVVKYLLLLEDGASSLKSESSLRKITPPRINAILTDSTSALATTKLVAELFYAKLEEVSVLCISWAKKTEGTGLLTPEKLQSVFSCLVLGALILPQLKVVNTRQSQETENIVFRTLRDLLEALSSLPESQSLYEYLLRFLRAYMPEFNSTDLSRFLVDLPYLHRLFADVSMALRRQHDQQSIAQNSDAMDIDDDFESQGSRPSALSNIIDSPRRESLVVIQASSFYNDTARRLHFIQQLSTDAVQVRLISTEFIDALMLLPDSELLSCRCFIRELFNSDLAVSLDDAQKVIERMGTLIGQLTFLSCEVALNICLDLMEGFITMWSDGNTELSSLIGDLYRYYLGKGLTSNLLSPKVRISLSRLLLRLAQVGENFHETVDMDPPNTSLLDILENSSLPVKFYIGSRLPSMFGRYILKIHEDMFVNILESLPTSNGFREGIALRLFVLGEVAREWPTLLRRGIYHIFETPGKVPSSKEHATYVLKRIAVTLELDDPRQLFDLFSSQLLYTWLDEGVVEDIPFEIFGFPDLEGLIHRTQADVVALMVMRAQDEALERLAQDIGTTSKELIQRNFSKTLAYSMAHDISMSKGEQQSGEGRLRKLLGREAFLENVYINFADIVGTFVALIDQEDPIERSWARDDNLANATEAMARIKKYGHSDVVLGANQQPTFRPKYLTREIALLCSRTEHELSTLWNPALVVSVARRLFNSIHRALGPLYACAVLRKVRVLICLAGPYAWNSYPLEMLLHSMRPYLVDTECADDCLGMSQFLLEKGYDALSKSPSFLAGYALTTLASLRVFLDTSQSSTTQESQFKATMSKARKFHEWFTKYLETYASSALKDGAQRDAFRVVTESAAHVRSSGNAERGTHESRLLLEILRDRDGGTSLLSEASHKLALEMLCRHFTMPATSSIDFLRSDEDARMLAKAVWRSCKSQKFNGEYLAWAGRVIGRSFASSGHIDDDLLRESQLSKYCRHAQGESASEQGILSLLQALTADSSHTKAGLAESALRTIVSEAIEQQDSGLMGACHAVLSDQLYDSSNWAPYRTPPSDDVFVCDLREDYMLLPDSIHRSNWAKNVAIHLVQDAPENIILSALSPILMNVEGFAKEAFPYIVHLTLLIERKSSQPARRKLSEALKKWFEMDSPIARDNICLLMNAILYLRTQPRPGENSIADRVQWLELDPTLASSAARKCGMHKTALLFIELSSSEGSRSSRRSSNVRAQESTDLLLDIFENIDDPDAYYGLSQIPSLPNVLSRLEYEKDGLKSLAFRGAQYDSHIRKGDAASVLDSQSLVGTLGGLGLSGLSNVLLRNQQSLDNSSSAVDSTFNTARKLEIWNLPALSSTRQPSVTIYKSYQALNQAAELAMVRRVAWSGFSELMQSVLQDDMSASSLRNHLGALAVLTEFNDTIDAVNSTELEQLLETFNNRSHWMKSGRYDEVGQILSCRDTTMSLLSQFANRSEMAKVNPPEARSIQVKSMLLSSSIHRYHQAFQESLNIATSLTHLVQPSADIGLSIDASARVEVANSLWDHGEMMSSIRTLQLIDEDTDLKKQTITVSRADLLAKTAHQISVARLEKPDSIHKNYLQPALKELRGKADGEEAGKVYHQFATFCDEQLQNPDSLEDLARLKHLRQGKLEEVKQLTKLIASAKDTHSKQRFTSHLARAKQWLGLDEQELRRVEQSRSEFVRLSLENYLLALVASDEYNNDALRFTALWLERALEDYTNEAVGKYIDKVPTRKFAPLMNQLTSRLLDQGSSFQRLLIELVYRICVDHPYHGMYQIWSGTKSKPKKEDEVAQLRKQATERVGKRLAHTETSAGIWTAIYHTSKAYHGLAVETSSYQGEYKGGEKHPITSSPAGQTLELALARFRIPPPTMQIQLSASRDYSSVPFITSLEPTMRIASGVSAPKIITIVGSNGEHFRQLVKGGNDDLRQDAIMEQVFAAVSSVLKLHRSTRQRNLGIRTYKVLPLTSVSGLIEFVSNTIPLHDYLMPAHEKYHPRDYKGSQCRKEIANVQTKSSDVRITTYKKVVDRFQPVMRYFFMEYFTDPDDWFAKRTAYTRTTAAISMLGHVLGLGDRHGHNILLDSKTGEVVHIDLGVAFESGRVLPVPELVPFRLTRDVVDGMGITKTEGVFRRCCEFTLDALREETYSIMTILDVLRYDPLYSWSISPLRVAKLQDPRRDEADAVPEAEIDSKKKSAATRSNGMVNEPSEADRALEVVRKKLSKTLSVTATVNDLINQATDERNLAVLYSGWAAYA